VLVRAPYEAGDKILLRHQTGFHNLVSLAGPFSAHTDDQYFVVLNQDGLFKVYNYTILENSQSHQRFAKDYFKVKLSPGGTSQQNSTTKKKLEETPGG
jgi:hypothetical protein